MCLQQGVGFTLVLNISLFRRLSVRTGNDLINTRTFGVTASTFLFVIWIAFKSLTAYWTNPFNH